MHGLKMTGSHWMLFHSEYHSFQEGNDILCEESESEIKADNYLFIHYISSSLNFILALKEET